MPLPSITHPIFSCAAAHEWETRLLGGDEGREWAAMRTAGAALAEAIECDFTEVGEWPKAGRLLVLAGKGHNGGDALLAARELLERHPSYGADVVFVHGERAMRPLAARAWRQLQEGCKGRLRVLHPKKIAGAGLAGSEAEALGEETSDLHHNGRGGDYVVSLDGIYGFQFRPPLDERAAVVLHWANGCRVAMRVAVDLPSGLAEEGAFRADWTYATGILKEPVLRCPNAGRIRYLDFGFFDAPEACVGTCVGTNAGMSAGEGNRARGSVEAGGLVFGSGLCVATEAALRGLAGWRAPGSDKRTHGHVAVIGGSRRYPGAALMAVQAALRSGVGLVTAFVPESLVTAGAARLPEAIWVGWPETPEGGLALEGIALWREAADRFSAALLGPGLGREPETLVLAEEILRHAERSPFVLDADALQPSVLEAGVRAGVQLVLTPHAGELARIAAAAGGVLGCADAAGTGGVAGMAPAFGAGQAAALASRTGAVVTSKGPLTRIHFKDTECVVCAGGPVLARGGSGDLLAGLTAGLMAQAPDDAFGAALRGALWHGRAADALARARGALAVQTTQLLDYLPEALPGR